MMVAHSTTRVAETVVESTTPVVETTTVVESTTPSKRLASPFEGLRAKVASAWRHGWPEVGPKVKQNPTLAVLEHSLGSVTDSVTVTKTGTVTETVTGSASAPGWLSDYSVTQSVTEGARAKPALCDCNPITGRRALKDPTSIASSMYQAFHKHRGSILGGSLGDRVAIATAPKGGFGEAFGEGLGEGLGEPFRVALVTARYHVDIGSVTFQ